MISCVRNVRTNEPGRRLETPLEETEHRNVSSRPMCRQRRRLADERQRQFPFWWFSHSSSTLLSVGQRQQGRFFWWFLHAALAFPCVLLHTGTRDWLVRGGFRRGGHPPLRSRARALCPPSVQGDRSPLCDQNIILAQDTHAIVVQSRCATGAQQLWSTDLIIGKQQLLHVQSLLSNTPAHLLSWDLVPVCAGNRC